ncbi:hypothetical protein [Anoxybacillus flavithermus]|uniref:hypothetical protein n=1 Tax=Anoxybacillus flavithermus TaxID=33934 RepID=UPI0007D947C2|nr:hypothetical protein [Anoxybacillus flavithermus]
MFDVISYAESFIQSLNITACSIYYDSSIDLASIENEDWDGLTVSFIGLNPSAIIDYANKLNVSIESMIHSIIAHELGHREHFTERGYINYNDIYDILREERIAFMKGLKFVPAESLDTYKLINKLNIEKYKKQLQSA